MPWIKSLRTRELQSPHLKIHFEIKKITRSCKNSEIEPIINDMLRGNNYTILWQYQNRQLLHVEVELVENGGSKQPRSENNYVQNNFPGNNNPYHHQPDPNQPDPMSFMPQIPGIPRQVLRDHNNHNNSIGADEEFFHGPGQVGSGRLRSRLGLEFWPKR